MSGFVHPKSICLVIDVCQILTGLGPGYWREPKAPLTQKCGKLEVEKPIEISSITLILYRKGRNLPTIIQ